MRRLQSEVAGFGAPMGGGDGMGLGGMSLGGGIHNVIDALVN